MLLQSKLVCSLAVILWHFFAYYFQTRRRTSIAIFSWACCMTGITRCVSIPSSTYQNLLNSSLQITTQASFYSNNNMSWPWGKISYVHMSFNYISKLTYLASSIIYIYWQALWLAGSDDRWLLVEEIVVMYITAQVFCTSNENQYFYDNAIAIWISFYQYVVGTICASDHWSI